MGSCSRRTAFDTAAAALLVFTSLAQTEARCPEHGNSAGDAPKMLAPAVMAGIKAGLRHRLGGASTAKEVDDEVERLFSEAQGDHLLLVHRQKNGEENLAEQDVKLCYYTTQVVAGTNYRVVCSTDDASDTYYSVTIYKPLPYMKMLPKVSMIKEFTPASQRTLAADDDSVVV